MDRPRHLISMVKDFIETHATELIPYTYLFWYIQCLSKEDKTTVSLLKPNLSFCRVMGAEDRDQRGGRSYRLLRIGSKREVW